MPQENGKQGFFEKAFIRSGPKTPWFVESLTCSEWGGGGGGGGGRMSSIGDRGGETRGERSKGKEHMLL